MSTVGLIYKETIQDIADAIREKTGSEDTFLPSEMAGLIGDIETGEGGTGAAPVLTEGVNFLNWKGACLYSYTWDEIAAITGLPETVDETTDEGASLVATGWNATLDTLQSFTRGGRYDVHMLYTTEDGADFIGTTEIHIAAGTTEIEEKAYYRNTSVKYVTLPLGLETVGASAFYGCTSLLSIAIPAGAALGDSAFFNCTSIESFTITPGTTLGKQTFQQCSALRWVSIPDDITELTGTQLFFQCKSLSSIDLSSVTSLGNSVFNGCTSLSSVDLSSVTSLGDYVFSGCTSLIGAMNDDVGHEVLDLSSVTSLGNSVFSGCTSLSSITIPSNLESCGTGVFEDCTGLSTIELDSAAPSGTSLFSGLPVREIINPDLDNYNITEYGFDLDLVSYIGTQEDGEIYHISVSQDLSEAKWLSISCILTMIQSASESITLILNSNFSTVQSALQSYADDYGVIIEIGE